MEEEAEADAIVVDAADDVEAQDEMDADIVPGTLWHAVWGCGSCMCGRRSNTSTAGMLHGHVLGTH